MNTNEIAHFYQLICSHIGIKVLKKEWVVLGQILQQRVSTLQLDSALDYFTLLQFDQQYSQQEWALLANWLRVGESYFLRDSGQMTLLETVILPELIQRNINTRSLRFLSAGCSTGEEAYSLAILLDSILPSWDSWNIKILGVDVDEHALSTARNGRYTDWSFRRVPEKIRDTYFVKQGSHWQVNPHIRTKVEFLRLNLVAPLVSFKHEQIMNLDLIVCRNVFIYFGQDTITDLVTKFTDILNPGGYLMTGHGELHDIKHPGLDICSFTNSLIYQKSAPGTQSTTVKQIPVRQPLEILDTAILNRRTEETILPVSQLSNTPERRAASKQPLNNSRMLENITRVIARPHYSAPNKNSVIPNDVSLYQPNNNQQPNSTDKFGELYTMMQQGNYNEVVTKGLELLRNSSQELEVWQLLAQAYANMGQYDEAASCCDRMLEIDVFHAPAYFLMSHLAMEKNDHERRLALLKKALYLDQNFIAPMLELAEIYTHNNDINRSKKLRLLARRLLKSLPGNVLVNMLDGWTAAELLEHIEA